MGKTAEHPLEIFHKTPAVRKRKTPVLFVHGAWHAAWCWADFMDYFATKGVESHAFSLRGHGGSVHDGSLNFLSIGDYVDDLKRVVRTFDTPPVIVAHSMGGLVLQKYLEEESCPAAALLTPVPTTGVLRTALNLIFTRPYALPSLLTFNLAGVVNRPDRARWALFTDRLSQEKVEEYTARLDSESYLAFVGMLVPAIRVNHHTRIPMFVLSAGQDNIFTVKEGRRTAKKYGARFQVLEDFPHDVMLEPNFTEAADPVLDWMDSLGLD